MRKTLSSQYSQPDQASVSCPSASVKLTGTQSAGSSLGTSGVGPDSSLLLLSESVVVEESVVVVVVVVDVVVELESLELSVPPTSSPVTWRGPQAKSRTSGSKRVRIGPR